MTDDSQRNADAKERWTTVQNRLKRLDKKIDEQNADVNRALAIAQAVNDKLDDLNLRVTAIDTRVAHAREQREHWFEQLSRITEDVLKNRALIREIEERAKT